MAIDGINIPLQERNSRNINPIPVILFTSSMAVIA
jgi:hypothetical protein